MIAFKLGFIDNQSAKEKLLSLFLNNIAQDELVSLGREYSQNRIPLILRKGALGRLIYHIESGHRVIIISASPEFWLEKWCHSVGVELIATKLAFKQGFFTGQFEGKNCYGAEKVNRLKRHLKPSLIDNYEEIIAYGDSRGDKEMFEIANEVHFQPFRES